MICGGDEIGRTQDGNNNAYAQDNEISWFDWNLDDRRTRPAGIYPRIVVERRQHPNLHRRKFFQDRRNRSRRAGAAGEWRRGAGYRCGCAPTASK